MARIARARRIMERTGLLAEAGSMGDRFFFLWFAFEISVLLHREFAAVLAADAKSHRRGAAERLGEARWRIERRQRESAAGRVGPDRRHLLREGDQRVRERELCARKSAAALRSGLVVERILAERGVHPGRGN